MSGVLWGLLAVPAAGGAVLTWRGVRSAAAGSGDSPAQPHPADRAGPVAAVLVAAVTLVLAGVAAVTRPAATAPLLAGIPASFAVDGLGAAMVVMVAAVTLVILIFAGYEFGPREPRARFCGLMLIFAAAMLATVTAGNLAVLLMGWEVMGAMSYALIAFHWRVPENVAAAETAFLTTRTADLGLYLAAGAALAGAGSLAFDALPGAGRPWLGLATAGVIVAAAGKSAQLPLSYWLSSAMRGPSGVSALLHSATMVAAGGYLLLRLEPLLLASGFGAPVVAWLGAATALLLGAVAVTQSDLKQLLAASTAAQLGFVVLAAGVGALAGGATQLVAHAAVKSLLFLGAGAWLVALGTRRLPDLAGAARRYPLVGTAFTVGAVTLAGVPPLALWSTKDLVLAGAWHDTAGLYLVGLAAAVLSALYAGRALALVWRPAPARPGYDTERAGTRTVGGAARLPLVLLAAATLALTAAVAPKAPVLADLRAALGGGPEPTTWEMVISALLAVAALAAVLWWGRRPAPAPRSLRDWLQLHRAARVAVVRPTFALAAALSTFDDRRLHAAVGRVAAAGIATARTAAGADDRGLDRAVRDTAAGTVALADQVRRRAERGVDGAVSTLVAGARWLGRLARRPQTGQVHTYYAQAVVGLLATAGLLVLLVLLAR